MTEPQMGAKVQDRNGKILGIIDYMVRDTWSGDVRKYIVYRKPPETDISFTPNDISEITEKLVTLALAVE